ncbi:PAS domain S-box protein [Halpernia frigidisoli]|uniref:histidine kinase n=1 Tax=Halpernia frigidisoli TaxID=1125876 RepID=A0A1I3IRZ9_9FLAO|nr:PAS domain S-box protein [Halpernia frigidisoli]SFI50662.1 PAS domain S-box-containing protein [Halpernia frigidisoli]
MASKLIKILLVEAFSDHIEMIRQILEKEYSNYSLEVTDTKEGLKQYIQKQDPDIILSNNNFPDFEGKSIFNLAKELAPQTPFIFISNAAKEESLIYFFRNGLADFILKDQIEELPSSIKIALEKFESKNCSQNTEDNLKNRIAALEKKEYLYRTLVENTEAIYTVLDENLNPIYRNPVIEKITGYTPTEIHGYDIFEIIHPQDRDLVYEYLDELKSKHGQIIPTSFRLKLKNGKYCWFEGTGNNQLSNPKLKGIILKFSDVSDRKKIETELAEKEAKYRAIFENSLDGIILSHVDGNIIRVNPAACKMFKMTEEEIIGKGRDGIIDKTDQGIETLLKERRETGSAKGVVNFIRKDGSSFSAFASSSKFVDSVGRERVSVSIHDLSERLKYQEKIDTTDHLLKKTVNRLNKTLDASMDVICTIDGEGKFIDVNAASLKIWGYTPKELKGTPFLDLVFKEDQEKTIREYSNIKHGSETNFFENRYVHKNGSIVNNLWSARWDKELQLALCIAKNITDRKKLEKTIQQEKKRFHDLYEKAPFGMGILKGPDHIYELANPPYLKIISKTDKSEVIGKTVKEVLPELEAQGIYELLDHVYQTGETFSASEMLFQFDFKGNGILDDVYLDFIYQAHRDPEGNIDGIFFFGHDVTEQVASRKKIERYNSELSSQIKITQNRQEELLIVNKELSDYKFAIDESCLVAITDQKGIITHTNDNFCIISKYTKEELIGQDHQKFNSGYHSEEFLQSIWKAVASGNTWKGELKNKAKDGTEYWVDTTITPFLDIKGKPYQHVTTQFDITERKKAEIDLDLQNKKLVKTNTELDRFVYSVSHDLRSPLTSILGIINFIEDESSEPETLKHIAMIRESVDRLDNFIKNILNYSRNNRLPLEVQKIDLQKNINEIVRSYRGNPDAKNIEFIIDIDQRQEFYTDQIRLNTIIENLISNSIKYHKEKGTNNFVKISSSSDSELLKLTVTDNGVGIDPKYHTKIFDMFYRLNSKKIGSGIGLYIVKDTIEILHGTITIDSELNKGTSFVITLKNLKPG